MRRPIAVAALAATVASFAVVPAVRADLGTLGNQLWHQDIAGVQGANETGDGFGSGVASGDFNCDGFDDLAVAVPGEDLTAVDAGAVQIFYGGPSGLTAEADEFWSQDSSGVPDAVSTGDAFGRTLLAFDFDCDLCDDLAIGVPGEDVQGLLLEANAGVVHVLWGSASGLTPFDVRGNTALLDQDDFSLQGARLESDDAFGAALAAGVASTSDRFLAVGSPGQDVDFEDKAGAVFLYTVRCFNDNFSPRSILHQDVTGVAGTAEANDGFGAALAAGDFNGDGAEDLAVGVPGEDVVSNTIANGGAVAIFYTPSSFGVVPLATGSRTFDQGSTDIAGTPEANERLGSVLVSGDFDNDGRDDLAVGIPFDRNAAGVATGAVLLLEGSDTGITATGSRLWRASDLGFAEASGDEFGEALATGDLSDDGRDDLVIGVPDAASPVLSGRVHVVFATFGGLTATGARSFRQGQAGQAETPELGDGFGRALAIGEFDPGPGDDLAIGAPGEGFGALDAAGAVAVLYDDVLGKVEFVGTSPVSLPESGPAPAPGLVRIRRTGSGVAPVTAVVEIVTDELLTAAPGFDLETYKPQTFTWGVGDFSEQGVPYPVAKDDLLPETDEDTRLVIRTVSTGYEGVRDSTRFVIKDDDAGEIVGDAYFSSASFTVGEGAGTATIAVECPTSQFIIYTCNVTWKAVAGTATAGADFEVGGGTFRFTSSARRNTFQVSILDDLLVEGDETIRLVLDSPDGTARLAGQSTATLVVRDDDVASAIFVDGFETGDATRWSAHVP